MQKARIVGIVFLLIAGLVTYAVSQGWFGGRAPLPIFPPPQPAATKTPNPADTITLSLVYSTEKKQWLSEAVNAWQSTNPTIKGRAIKVELIPEGSQNIVTKLVDGSLKPVMVSPASTMQVTQMNAALIDGKQNIANNVKPLVSTPIVVVAWQSDNPNDPVNQLKSNDPQLWTNIQKFVSSGKRDFLFGQTMPNMSNSGLQTFMLMAAEYHNVSTLTDADIRDAAFIEWITNYAKNVAKFGDSTGTFIDEMIRFGPSQYTAIAVYESTALEKIATIKNRAGNVRIIYPAVTILSDHPLVILDASWVTSEQRDAAQQFRDFLLSEAQQQQAVKYGFRPSNPDVKLDAPDSLFLKYKDGYGVQLEPSAVISEPNADVVKAMLDLWQRLSPQVRR